MIKLGSSVLVGLALVCGSAAASNCQQRYLDSSDILTAKFLFNHCTKRAARKGWHGKEQSTSDEGLMFFEQVGTKCFACLAKCSYDPNVPYRHEGGVLPKETFNPGAVDVSFFRQQDAWITSCLVGANLMRPFYWRELP